MWMLDTDICSYISFFSTFPLSCLTLPRFFF
jgi:hypothetical protein